MTIAEAPRFHAPATLIKAQTPQVAEPEIFQLERYKSVAMPFQIDLPRNWHVTLDKPGHCGFAPETPTCHISISRYRDAYNMSAEQIANGHQSAETEAVTKPEKIDIGGNEAWTFDIFRNPAAFRDGETPEILRRFCIFKDPKGMTWTIIFSAQSSRSFEEKVDAFEEILSSFHLTEK